MRRALFFEMFNLLFFSVLWAQPQSSEIFLKQGDRLVLTLTRVERRVLFSVELTPIYLKVVDSVRTKDQVIAAAILQQKIENIKSHQHGDALVLDFSQAIFPHAELKKAHLMIYKSANFTISNEKLNRFGFQFDYGVHALRPLILRLEAGYGTYTNHFQYDGLSYGHGAGVDLARASWRFAVMVNYARKVNFAQLHSLPNLSDIQKLQKSFSAYNTWFVSSDMKYRFRGSSLALIVGANYWFLTKKSVDGQKSTASFWMGFGWHFRNE